MNQVKGFETVEEAKKYREENRLKADICTNLPRSRTKAEYVQCATAVGLDKDKYPVLLVWKV